jgi:hypothetical protein
VTVCPSLRWLTTDSGRVSPAEVNRRLSGVTSMDCTRGAAETTTRKDCWAVPPRPSSASIATSRLPTSAADGVHATAPPAPIARPAGPEISLKDTASPSGSAAAA